MSNEKSGFTLIEVLVALVVISLAFMGFMMSLSATANNYRFLNDKVIATLVATNVMTQVREGLLPFQIGTPGNQTQKMANRQWQNVYIVNKTQDKDILDIKVEVKDNKNQTILILNGFISGYVNK
jgi:general secretion pathway protein I